MKTSSSPWRIGAARLVLSTVIATAFATPAVAQEDHEHDELEHGHGIHFTHPLFAESLSPDTKMRLDYSRHMMAGDVDANEMEMEGEYAFTSFFSIEAGMHYELDTRELGETDILFKFANSALAETGVHLGYGIEIGLPTGTGHAHGGVRQDEQPPREEGEDIWEFSPFLNAGLIAGQWELGIWTLFDIPTNQGEPDEVGSALRVNGSILLHAGSRLAAILETFGHTGLSGPETDLTVINVAPGIRIRPVASSPVVIGTALALPVSSDEDYESRVLLSAFWHF